MNQTCTTFDSPYKEYVNEFESNKFESNKFESNKFEPNKFEPNESPSPDPNKPTTVEQQTHVV